MELSYANFADNAGTVAVVNYDLLLGSTTYEKWEGIYLKIAELTNIIIEKGGSGQFWIICPSWISDIIAGRPGFYPHMDRQHISLGKDIITDEGILSRRWRVYTDRNCDEECLLVGVGDDPTDNKSIARLRMVRGLDG